MNQKSERWLTLTSTLPVKVENALTLIKHISRTDDYFATWFSALKPQRIHISHSVLPPTAVGEEGFWKNPPWGEPGFPYILGMLWVGTHFCLIWPGGRDPECHYGKELYFLEILLSVSPLGPDSK